VLCHALPFNARAAAWIAGTITIVICLQGIQTAACVPGWRIP
jgi:hypothetical protein